MRLIVLHNPGAGTDAPSKRALRALFTRAGHEIVYVCTKSPEWEWKLREPADAVVIAGGDGTLSQVALRVAQRGLPFALLPLGMANNVATAVGEKRPIGEIVAGLEGATERRLDLGTVATRLGSRPFIESVGAGLMLELFRTKIRKQKIGPRRDLKRIAALKRLGKIASRYPGVDCRLDLDGEELAGRFLLVEIMNAGWIGPNLPLAPDAPVDDGMVDVICVEVEKRREFRKYVEQVLAREPATPPAQARRCRSVELLCGAGELHVDDEALDVAVARLEVESGALRLLGPSETTRA
jgi:diacylglycerol kinase family enzyme